MDVISNSLEKMKKNDLEKSKSEEEEEEVNLDFEKKTDNLTARFKLEKDLKESSDKEEKKDIHTRKSEFEMERFNLDRDLNCLEKKSHSDEEKEEERMKGRLEDEDGEYICYVCGMRGHKFLGYYFSAGCNQLAHMYCAETTNNESKVINNESKVINLEAKVMDPLLSEFFEGLKKSKTSVIDHFILSVEDFILKKQK